MIASWTSFCGTSTTSSTCVSYSTICWTGSSGCSGSSITYWTSSSSSSAWQEISATDLVSTTGGGRTTTGGTGSCGTCTKGREFNSSCIFYYCYIIFCICMYCLLIISCCLSMIPWSDLIFFSAKSSFFLYSRMSSWSSTTWFETACVEMAFALWANLSVDNVN